MSSYTQPSSPDSQERLVRFEHYALYSFAFVLPLFEAPKNLLWLTYAGLWLYNRTKAHSFGGPWNIWDTLIAVWICSGYAVAAFAGIRHTEFDGANDILRYGSVLWMLTRAGYDDDVLKKLLLSVIAGTAVTLGFGAWGVISGKRYHLGLRSVGHVNHSAIYLAIAFGAALSWLRFGWRTNSLFRRGIGLLTCLLFGASLLSMESRAAAGACLIAAVVVLAVFALRNKASLLQIVIGTTALIALLVAVKPEIIEKSAARLDKDQVLSSRDAIWLVGIEAWREFPLFGVGMSNFGRINHELIAGWARKRAENPDPDRFLPSSHAHSLYVNTLAERGILGLCALVAVLLAWLYSLLTRIPRATSPPLHWIYWGAATFAWLIAIIVGLVNTTLHTEHALVSMLFLGGWLSLSRR